MLEQRALSKKKEDSMAKTIVQTREELSIIRDQVEKIAHRFKSEFGEDLMIDVSGPCRINVGIDVSVDSVE